MSDKDVVAGLVKLWRSGTFGYRAALIASWPPATVMDVFKALGVKTAQDLVEAMKEGLGE